MRRALLVLVLAVTAGCPREKPASGPRPGDPIPPGGPPAEGVAREVDPAPAAPAATVAGRRRGAAHAAQIVAVAACPDGACALSRDLLGGIRVWPALDGTREPQVAPVRGAEAMSIAARTDGSLAAFVDGGGLATLVRFDADGLVRATATMSPDVPFAGVVVLPGGERAVAVRLDQRLALVDADGRERGHVAVRGAQVVALHAAGDDLVALLRRMEGDQPRFELRRLSATGDALRWDGDALALPAPVAQLPHVASALSPDAALLAYVGQAKDGHRLHVVRVATGAPVRLDDDVTFPSPATTMIGFTGDARLEVAATTGAAWRVEIDGDVATAYTAALAPGTAAPAFARGLRIVGHQASLGLHEDGGAVAYLGHRELAATTGALSPDGAAAAWVTSSGAIVVQWFDGRDDLRIKDGRDWYGSVAFVDANHLLAGHADGRLSLLDARTGEALGSTVVAKGTPWFVYEPSTRLVAVMRDAGTVWALGVEPGAAEPFGAPVAVADGAQVFALTHPDVADGAVLVTVDAQQRMRRYTAAELADGVSAAEMKRDRIALNGPAWLFDRAGRHYVASGTGIEVRNGGTAIRTIDVGHPIADVWPSPGGHRLVVGDASGRSGPARLFDADGAPAWTAPMPAHLVAWSSDGARVLLVTHGAAVVLDVATGEPIAAPRGWAFARSNEIPSVAPLGVESPL